jgi:dTDP-4-dehydrorhamnose 3,5-epimerase
MIEGVCITPLRQIEDERGKVMHMLRSDSPAFAQFGEVYFSSVLPGAVKAWKLHQEMTLNLAVPSGLIKLVLYDDRNASNTKGKIQEIVFGEGNYCLVTVPPKVWSGFKSIGDSMAMLANCATLPHSPEECKRCNLDDESIPYDWALNA